MAKVTEKLTQSQRERAKPKEKDYKLVDGGGLYLLVKVNESKLFYYKKQRNGKIYNDALGNLKDITLKEVRVLANKKLAEVENTYKNTEIKALKITF
ncbi:Arm DNA-binding domain-containing protein [Campylobacter devanensis]|uniref:Arm DNA-binding domain-containing protein n=1 Tax=Campylobacter devanensis TaxID=3161138 RepID=UPI000A336EF8|nr:MULTISPECIES: Arm DNA-binding domain-containing protein [unclassified Campylobacter]